MNNDTSRTSSRRRVGLPPWFDEEDEIYRDDELDDAAAPLPLSPSQQAALAAAIEADVQRRGCDNTLRAAQAWAAQAGLDWDAVRAGLEGNGGWCDCEVLLNVGLSTA